MKNKFEFHISESDWKYVEESGLPEEDTWCLVIWKDSNGDFDYHVGGYFEKDNEFYVNFGLGGCVLSADSVVAWVPLFAGDNFLWQVEDSEEQKGFVN